jgi:CheY-like chemotaxis protein
MARVLLVEDEPWLGELYMQLLSGAGHTVRWCQDGYDAIAAVDTKLPQVIVLDLLLPWANGLQLLHELASYVDLATIPVLICSNAVSMRLEEAEVLQAYGVVGVLNKATLQPRQLITAVQEALHAHLPN